MEGAEPGSLPVLEEAEVPCECGAKDTYPLTLCTQTEAAAPGPGGPVGSSRGRAPPGPAKRYPAPRPALPRPSVLPFDPHSFLFSGLSPEGNSQGLRNSLRPCCRLGGGGGPWTPRIWGQEIMRCKNLSGVVRGLAGPASSQAD